jgi:hypothetical protein
MAWERRAGRRYYYLGKRVGATVRKIYYGRHGAAKLAARFDAEDRRRRVAEAGTLEAERARTHTAQCAANDLESAVTMLTEAALLAAGYRKHDHGAWRRPRW